MRRLWTTLAAAALLAGCAGDPGTAPAPSPPPASTPATAPATAAAPAPAAPISLPPAAVSVVPPPPPDQCGAYELAGLIGKPRSAIPVPVNPARRRVVCSTCPRTEDFNPSRLTIEYDAATGRVTKLGCN